MLAEQLKWSQFINVSGINRQRQQQKVSSQQGHYPEVAKVMDWESHVPTTSGHHSFSSAEKELLKTVKPLPNNFSLKIAQVI